MTEADQAGNRLLFAGFTGYMGQALAKELVGRGYHLVCPVRERSGPRGQWALEDLRHRWPEVDFRVCDVCDLNSLEAVGLGSLAFDGVVSCLSTRGGGITDAWQVDHQANLNLLQLAERAHSKRFLLLSAICVQKPLLEFQRAKLAFEQRLAASGLDYRIVRPTAFFKSLAGQIKRVKAGKSFLVFGDGRLTACKPIAEQDLSRFMANSLSDPNLARSVLPIGGPGAAITPLDQGELLFRLTGTRPKFRHVPVKLFDAVIAALSLPGRFSARLRDKAEFARIGRYYATESMLWLDPETGEYDADATPSFGSITLSDFYNQAIRHGLEGQDLGEAAVFK